MALAVGRAGAEPGREDGDVTHGETISFLDCNDSLASL
jgi:hypothetical protein